MRAIEKINAIIFHFACFSNVLYREWSAIFWYSFFLLKCWFSGEPRNCKKFPGTCPKDKYQRLFVFNATYVEWIYKDKDAVVLESYSIDLYGKVKSRIISIKMRSVLGDGPPIDWVSHLSYDKNEDAYYLPMNVSYGDGYRNACGMYARDPDKYPDDYILNKNCLSKKICNAIEVSTFLGSPLKNIYLKFPRI